ncbi:hypothetical protein SEVIR_9G370800v4 [Setaria viridis]|uniref:Uncharacterized protein n=1 Tax=Setaria viridis TaxID=4556 RepID=A0A4V6D4Z2_SETVI|nr:uncharacterized protein LOC117839541 [Setaria viridis]TKV95545.1 hypothetical protein SEVIR_9G370800v2 [Setaria viridis]
MDPHPVTGPAASDADDWDNDDFVIPSFSVEESNLGDWEAARASDPQPPPKATKDTENIYLGPHGAPPSRAKKPEDTSATTGFRDKNKAREADQKVSGAGRNNKGDFHRHNGGNHAKDPFKRGA